MSDPQTVADLLKWIERREEEIVAYANKHHAYGEMEQLRLKLAVSYERSASLMAAFVQLLRIMQSKQEGGE